MPEEVRRGAYVVASGYDAMQELMRLDERPTVVVCFKDLVAIGALNAARLLGKRVPEDVSITGWDDFPISSWEIIQLTTMRQSMVEMARLLVDRIEGRADSEAKRVLFEPELVLRATLQPPAATS